MDTGAIQVISPGESKKVDPKRIFKAPARFLYTNKSKDMSELIAKGRMVMPGHRDPDGDIPVVEGGFRTDAPTCGQTALHMLISKAVRSKWRLKSFDINNALLSGKEQERISTSGLPRQDYLVYPLQVRSR